jgi:hypothetical protein
VGSLAPLNREYPADLVTRRLVEVMTISISANSWDSYRNRYYFGYNVVSLAVTNAAPGTRRIP